MSATDWRDLVLQQWAVGSVVPDGLAPDLSLDLAAAVRLAQMRGLGARTVERLVTTAAGSLNQQLHETHRGAFVAILEGWTLGVGRDEIVSPQALFDLLRAEAEASRCTDSGSPLSVTETLAWTLAGDAHGTAHSTPAETAVKWATRFADDLGFGGRWAKSDQVHATWPDARPHSVAPPTPVWDELPFTSLAQAAARELWPVAVRMSTAYRADPTLYDRAPCHFLAVATLWEGVSAGERRGMLLRLCQFADIAALPQVVSTRIDHAE